MEGWKDRPYFIGPFRLPLWIQKMGFSMLLNSFLKVTSLKQISWYIFNDIMVKQTYAFDVMQIC